MNTICGKITGVAPGPQANQSLVTIDQFLEDVNQYENGRLRLGPPPARQFNTLGNTAGANATIRVQNDAQGAPPVNQPFDLHDDDDDAVLPRLPDLAWMNSTTDNVDVAKGAANLLAWAYIRPVEDGGGLGNSADTQDVPFVLNAETPALREAAIRVGKNSQFNSQDFWVAYILAAFQGQVRLDLDPGRQGWVIGVTRVRDPIGSLIYLETIRDLALQPEAQRNRASAQDIERATVVHEVGHQLGACDGEPGIMDGGWPVAEPIPTTWAEQSLNRIRSLSQPAIPYAC